MDKKEKKDVRAEKREKRNERAHDIRPEDFHWVVFGIGAGILFVLFVAAFAIVRIADGMWLSWQLPAILAIAYLAVVTAGAMLFAIKTVKQEITKEQAKTEKK